MRTKILASSLALMVSLVPAPSAAERIGVPGSKIPPCASELQAADHADHTKKDHPGANCKMKVLAALEVSKKAGLGQVEIHKNLAAVLGRDEGVVTLIDIRNPRKPKVLGRYDDGIADSYDGDLAFSKDGRWLFYARQTHQFSKDGVHVLDVSNPKQPALAFYQPQGGSFRIGYLNHEGTEYVITMDAIAGLVISRFDRTSGALVPVHVDALPALKVGGPASAGVFVDPKDPKLGVPLLYATNGRTGLDIYDLSQPASPTKIGSWTDAGLADVEVQASKKGRRVYAASEYWFASNTPASAYVLDATKPGSIKQRARWTAPLSPMEPWRINGMELTKDRLHVALSHAGLGSFSLDGLPRALYQKPRPINKDASLKASPYAMDVDSAGGLLYLTDASSGYLTILKPR